MKFTVWVRSGHSAANPVIIEAWSMKVSTYGALTFWSKGDGKTGARLVVAYAPGQWMEAEQGEWNKPGRKHRQ